VDLVLFLISYYAARKGNNDLAITFFFLFCYCAGILCVPVLLLFGKFNVFVYGAISLGIGGVSIVYLTGLILKERFFSEGSFWSHLGIIIVLYAVFEISMIFLLGITSIFTITLSLIVMAYIILLTLLYGAALSKRIKKDFWMFWTLRILGVLILSILMIILLITIILLVAAGDGDFDFGGFDLVGGGSIKKDKEKKLYEKTSFFKKRIKKS
jgi:hypothetical protein